MRGARRCWLRSGSSPAPRSSNRSRILVDANSRWTLSCGAWAVVAVQQSRALERRARTVDAGVDVGPAGEGSCDAGGGRCCARGGTSAGGCGEGCVRGAWAGVVDGWGTGFEPAHGADDGVCGVVSEGGGRGGFPIEKQIAAEEQCSASVGVTVERCVASLRCSRRNAGIPRVARNDKQKERAVQPGGCTAHLGVPSRG